MALVSSKAGRGMAALKAIEASKKATQQASLQQMERVAERRPAPVQQPAYRMAPQPAALPPAALSNRRAVSSPAEEFLSQFVNTPGRTSEIATPADPQGYAHMRGHLAEIFPSSSDQLHRNELSAQAMEAMSRYGVSQIYPKMAAHDQVPTAASELTAILQLAQAQNYQPIYSPLAPSLQTQGRNSSAFFGAVPPGQITALPGTGIGGAAKGDATEPSEEVLPRPVRLDDDYYQAMAAKYPEIAEMVANGMTPQEAIDKRQEITTQTGDDTPIYDRPGALSQNDFKDWLITANDWLNEDVSTFEAGDEVTDRVVEPVVDRSTDIILAIPNLTKEPGSYSREEVENALREFNEGYTRETEELADDGPFIWTLENALGIGTASAQEIQELHRQTTAWAQEELVEPTTDTAIGKETASWADQAKQAVLWGLETAQIPAEHSANAIGTGIVILTFGMHQLARDAGLGSIAERVDESPTTALIVDSYVNGYTSDTGIEFTGGRAVFEAVLGYADNLPWPIEKTIKLAAAVFTDPLTYVPVAGWVGRIVRTYGRGAKLMQGASRAQRLLGLGVEGTGAALQTSARALDLPFELMSKAFKQSRFAQRGLAAYTPEQQVGDAVARVNTAARNIDSIRGSDQSLKRVREAIRRADESDDVRIANLKDPKKPEENLLAPVAGRNRPFLIDDPVNAAISNPTVAGQAEQVYRFTEPRVAKFLDNESWHLKWNPDEGIEVWETGPITTKQASVLSRTHKNAINPLTARNSVIKETLENIARIEADTIYTAPALRRFMPDQFDISIRMPRRGSGRGAKYSYTDENLTHLVERFIKTRSDQDANSIAEVLWRSKGAKLVAEHGGERPFIVGVPDKFFPELFERMHAARDQFQWVVNASDDEIAAAIDNNLIRVFKGPADRQRQLAGGLTKKSQQAAKQIDELVKKDVDRRARQLKVNPPNSRLGRFLQQAKEAAAPDVDVGQPNFQNVEVAYHYHVGDMPLEVAEVLDKEVDFKFKGVNIGENPRVIDVLDGIEQARVLADDAGEEFNERAAQRLLAAKVGDIPEEVLEKSWNRWVKRYNDALSLNRQARLYNAISGTAGATGDFMGNNWAAVVNGQFDIAMTPWGSFGWFRAYREGWLRPSPNGRNIIAAMESTGSPAMRETGQIYPSDLMPGFTKGETPVEGLPDFQRATQGLPGVYQGSHLFTIPAIKDFRNATDAFSRRAAYDATREATIKNEAIPALMRELRGEFGDDTEIMFARILAEAREKGGDEWTGFFSPGDVRDALKGTTKRNVDFSRKWQAHLNRASDAGMEAQRRIYFTYKNTGLDEITRNVFTFHYWQTRALPMHMRAALRSPVLINLYYRLWNHIQLMAEQNDLPWWAQGMLQFHQFDDGIRGLFDPIGLLLPTTVLDAVSNEGSPFAVFLNQINPILLGAANALGWIDIPANYSGTRSLQRFATHWVNWAIANNDGTIPEDFPVLGSLLNSNDLRMNQVPEDTVVKGVMEAVNERLQGLPGVGEFEPFDKRASEMDQLRSWGQYAVIQAYGLDGVPQEEWPQEALDALDATYTALENDLDDPFAASARKLYAQEGLYQNLFFWVPGGIVINSGWRNQQIEQSGEYWESDEDKRTEQQKASTELRQQATSAEPAFQLALGEYYRLGSESERGLYNYYYNLIYDPPNPEVANAGRGGPDMKPVIELQDGTTIDLSDLYHMEESDRFDWVENLFIEQGWMNGVNTVSQLRETFKSEHAEIGEYTEYQRMVNNEDAGGAREYREKTAEDNPYFARVMAEQREQLIEQGYDGEGLEAELDAWADGREAYNATFGYPHKEADRDEPRVITGRDNALLSNRELAERDQIEADKRAQQEAYAKDQEGKEDAEPELTADEQEAKDIRLAGVQEEFDRAFANNAAEAIYGDLWDHTSITPDNADGWINDDHPKTAYWPNGSGVGDKTNADRYAEWVAYVEAVHPGYDTSIEAWQAWEDRIYRATLSQMQETPSLWKPYLPEWLEEQSNP